MNTHRPERRRPRSTDRASCGQPFLGVVDMESRDPIVSRLVDGPSGLHRALVGFDGETIVLRVAAGQEWYFGLDDLLGAIGYERRAPRREVA